MKLVSDLERVVAAEKLVVYGAVAPMLPAPRSPISRRDVPTRREARKATEYDEQREASLDSAIRKALERRGAPPVELVAKERNCDRQSAELRVASAVSSGRD